MIDLRQGDCLELMMSIPDGSVDLTVTSPPYDNLRTYNGNNDQWSADVWQKVIDELYRVTKDGGVVVWVVGDATIKGSETGTSFRQVLHAMDCGFNLHDTMIYNKGSFRFPSSNRYHNVFEYMFVWSKGKPKTFNMIKDRENTNKGEGVRSTARKKDGSMYRDASGKKVFSEFGGRFNIWKVKGGWHHTTSFLDAFKHPALMPEKLAYDHILSWSNEGDIVFDPFMGSGTTGAMAKLNNRKFIGVELDKDYFKIAEERINQAAENSGFLMPII